MSSNATFLGVDSSMKAPLISSAIFHLILFVLTATGLPMVAKEPMILNTPITIELVERAQKTQTPEPAKPKKPPPAPAMAAEEPPDLTLPEPEPEKPKEEKKEMAPPEVVPNPDVKPTPPKKEQKKDEKKPDPKATKVEKKEPKKDFSSLLKNLAPDVEEAEPKPSQMDQLIEEMKDDSQFAPLGERLTMSEQDALRHQLSQCWNVLSGAAYAENLVVEVKVIVNRDRTINRAMILDKGRYNRDAPFRAAADAALRALRNPRCSPLKLPPNKYDEWKTTIINFDPRDML